MPDVPPTAPLSYRLSSEVYALDGLGGCYTGPEIHPPGRPHHHMVRCDTSFDHGHKHSLGLFVPEKPSGIFSSGFLKLHWTELLVAGRRSGG